MTQIYVPTTSPEDWQRLLKDPVKHWKTGYSARTLAYCWHEANGLPTEITSLFTSSDEIALHSVQPLLILPEKITPVAGRGEPPHSDVFVLAKAADGHLISLTVEGKVNESFGNQNQRVQAWKQAGNVANHRVRLDQLLDKIQLNETQADEVAYQLVQRTASAVIEAETFNARYAVMIVHSFSPTHTNYDAFLTFVAAYGKVYEAGQLIEIAKYGDIRLVVGWAQGHERYLAL